MTARSGEVGPGLERRALGFVPVLFQSIVFAGPAVGVALSLVFLASYAGGATPLATILTTLAILLIAVSIGELGSKLPSAGGLYTYVAAGMGDAWGFMLSWLLGAAYLIIDAGLIVLLLGLIAQDNLTSQLGAPNWLWAPIVVFCICVATGLVISGIKPSAKVQVVMGVFEMAVFSVLAIWLIIKAGNRNTLSAFSPNNGNANGWGSIFAAMIYGVLAFAGFESAAFLAEEAREPRRAVRRAVVGSVVVIGIFWTLAMYAGVVYWGPGNINLGKDTFVAYNRGDPWDGIAHLVWGGAWVLVLIAVLNSAWASLIGEFNAGSRVAFALGRVKLLSPHAARIHRKLRTPWIAAIGLAADRDRRIPDLRLRDERTQAAGRHAVSRRAGHAPVYPDLHAGGAELPVLLLAAPPRRVQCDQARRPAGCWRRVLRAGTDRLAGDQLRRPRHRAPPRRRALHPVDRARLDRDRDRRVRLGAAAAAGNDRTAGTGIHRRGACGAAASGNSCG